MNRRGTSQLGANRIIDVFLSSEAMADIVLLFRRNPKLIDYGDHIASRIGRKGESVEEDLKKLAKLGVLNAEKIGKKTWFGFGAKKDKQIQEIIKNYVRSCSESGKGRFCVYDEKGKRKNRRKLIRQRDKKEEDYLFGRP